MPVRLDNPFPPPFTPIPQALGEDLHTEVGAFRINEASFAVVPTELDPQIGEIYRDHMEGAEHTFIIGLDAATRRRAAAELRRRGAAASAG